MTKRKFYKKIFYTTKKRPIHPSLSSFTLTRHLGYVGVGRHVCAHIINYLAECSARTCMCQQVCRLRSSRVSKASVIHWHSCILCTCPIVFVLTGKYFSFHHSLALGLWFFERTIFCFFLFFSCVYYFSGVIFVFVLVLVLGRGGCDTLPQHLNSERVPTTITYCD